MWLEPRAVTKSELFTHQVRKFHPFVHAVPSAWNILLPPRGGTVWGGEPDCLGSNPASTTCISCKPVQVTCASDVHLRNGTAGGPYFTQGSEDSESVHAQFWEQFQQPVGAVWQVLPIFCFSCSMQGLFNCGMWDLVCQPGIEPEHLVSVGVWNLSQWTSREVPPAGFLDLTWPLLLDIFLGLSSL